MALVDASKEQGWVAAFDAFDRAKRRYDAAGQIGDTALIAYLREQLETAANQYRAATKALRAD